MTEPAVDPQLPATPDFDAIVASPHREPLRVVHLMAIVLIAGMVAWFFLLAGPFAVISLGVMGFAAIVVAGALAGRRRASRQDALLSVMAIAAEKGMPLAPAVAAFATQFRWGARRVMLRLANLLNAGASLSESLATVPGLLSKDAELLARVGEQAGVLPKALRAGAAARAGSMPALTAIALRITYVLVLLTVMQTIMGFLLYFILPKFEAIFKDFGLSLPYATIAVIDATHYLMAWFPLFAMMLLAELVLILILPFKIMGLSNLDIPLLDRLFRRRHTALILRALSLVVDQKKPIELGLDCLARNYPKRWVRRRLIEVDEEVRRGDDWCVSLWRHGLIRESDGALLASAKTTGNLAWAMRELADTSDRRSIIRLQAAIQLLFPLVIVSLGALVLLVALAYFGPLIQLIERIGPV